MDRGDLIRHVQALGRSFVRLGMHEHARKLRVYYLALRRELTAGPAHKIDLTWSGPFVVDWMKTLRVAPFADAWPVRPRGSPCARCPAAGNAQTTLHTDVTFPTGARMRCHRCGATWLELG